MKDVKASDTHHFALVGHSGDGKTTRGELQFTRDHAVPAVAFVNGNDRDEANFQVAINALRDPDVNPLALTLSIGAGSTLRGVIDLLEMKAYGPDRAKQIPHDTTDHAEAAREQPLEAIAESDDGLLEHSLDVGSRSENDVECGLLAGARTGSLPPALARSALSGIGVDPLFRALRRPLPSDANAPAAAKPSRRGSIATREPCRCSESSRTRRTQTLRS